MRFRRVSEEDGHVHTWGRSDVIYRDIWGSPPGEYPTHYETAILSRCIECLTYNTQVQVIDGHFRIQLADGSWRTPPRAAYRP